MANRPSSPSCVTIHYAHLPAYLGLAPQIPIYHQRQELRATYETPGAPLCVFEAFIPAESTAEDRVYIQSVAASHFHAERCDLYLVTAIPPGRCAKEMPHDSQRQ